MTDQTTDPKKKTFFGGQVNFNDSTAFKAVDGSTLPIADEEDFSLPDEPLTTEESLPTEEVPTFPSDVEEEKEKADDTSDTTSDDTFDDFDPFENEELLEPVSIEETEQEAEQGTEQETEETEQQEVVDEQPAQQGVATP
jgi:hypothetical protein